MTRRELERALQRQGLSRTHARVLMSRGKRWIWLGSLSPRLFATFVTWQIR